MVATNGPATGFPKIVGALADTVFVRLAGKLHALIPFAAIKLLVAREHEAASNHISDRQCPENYSAATA